MKYISLSILLLVSLLCWSCEKTEVVDVEIPEVEKIVVEAEIKSGEIFEGVRITRTLPISNEFNFESTFIEDAYAYLMVNSIKIIPLHYKGEGIYNAANNDLRILAGDKVEFFAKIKGRDIYSITKAPQKPEIISVKYNKEGFFEVRINAEKEEAYGALWVIAESPLKKADNFYSIYQMTDGSTQSIQIRTKKLDEKYLNTTYDTKRRVQVIAFDQQFAEYFKTSTQSSPSENSVITGGSGVAWNIKGEDVIGLFIGVAEGYVYDPL